MMKTFKLYNDLKGIEFGHLDQKSPRTCSGRFLLFSLFTENLIYNAKSDKQL